MKKLVSVLISLGIVASGFAQKIHSPAELLKIMSDSKVSYNLDKLNKAVDCKDVSDKLNYHDYYRVKSDSGMLVYKITLNDRAEFYFDLAEKYFQAGNMDSALVYYKRTLDADTSAYTVITYIGQIYEHRRDIPTAIAWYKKAIEKNYIDYMAHWFLADSYFETKDIDNAVDEIVIAQILNRNNPRIKEAVQRIFTKAKRNTDDWCFNPQVEINKISDSKINVAFDSKWLGYAIAKAIWLYEPGYSESMGVAPGHYSTIEDKECLISMLIGIENAKIKIKKDPQLKILKDASEKKQLDGYVLYDIVLPENPFVAFQLSEETISAIKDYVLSVRNTK